MCLWLSCKGQQRHWQCGCLVLRTSEPPVSVWPPWVLITPVSHWLLKGSSWNRNNRAVAPQEMKKWRRDRAWSWQKNLQMITKQQTQRWGGAEGKDSHVGLHEDKLEETSEGMGQGLVGPRYEMGIGGSLSHRTIPWNQARYGRKWRSVDLQWNFISLQSKMPDISNLRQFEKWPKKRCQWWLVKYFLWEKPYLTG